MWEKENEKGFWEKESERKFRKKVRENSERGCEGIVREGEWEGNLSEGGCKGILREEWEIIMREDSVREFWEKASEDILRKGGCEGMLSERGCERNMREGKWEGILKEVRWKGILTKGTVVVVKSLSYVPHFFCFQAPLSKWFSRQEYWSGSPFPSPGDLPNPGIEPRSSTLQADSLPSEPPGKAFI